MSRQFHLSHPLWAQPHPHSFVSWLKEAKKKDQGTQSVCAVLSEVQLCVHDETANGDSELWKEVKLSTMCSNLLSCLFTWKWPSPPIKSTWYFLSLEMIMLSKSLNYGSLSPACKLILCIETWSWQNLNGISWPHQVLSLTFRGESGLLPLLSCFPH